MGRNCCCSSWSHSSASSSLWHLHSPTWPSHRNCLHTCPFEPGGGVGVQQTLTQHVHLESWVEHAVFTLCRVICNCLCWRHVFFSNDKLDKCLQCPRKNVKEISRRLRLCPCCHKLLLHLRQQKDTKKTPASNSCQSTPPPHNKKNTVNPTLPEQFYVINSGQKVKPQCFLEHKITHCHQSLSPRDLDS